MPMRGRVYYLFDNYVIIFHRARKKQIAVNESK